MLIYMLFSISMLFSALNSAPSSTSMLNKTEAIATAQNNWISINNQFKELCFQGLQEITLSNLETLLLSWDAIITRAQEKSGCIKTVQEQTNLVRPRITKILDYPQNKFTQASITLLKNPLYDNNLIALTARAHQLGLLQWQVGKLQKILVLLFGPQTKNYYNLLVNLKSAIFEGDQKSVFNIILQNTPINGVVTKYGRTGLMTATMMGWTDIVTILLTHSDIAINAQDLTERCAGWTALHHAVSRGRLKICKLLLNHPNLDINIQTTAGNTAVMLAAQNGDSKILDAIFEKFPHVDLSIRNREGKRALDLAPKKWIAQMLIAQFHKQRS